MTRRFAGVVEATEGLRVNVLRVGFPGLELIDSSGLSVVVVVVLPPFTFNCVFRSAN